MLDGYADRWALVTGASSGIGAEFATVLAERGMHLVLASRRSEPLNQLAQELHTKHGTRCEIFCADLSESAAAANLVNHLASKNLTIELLVNNAGFGLVGEVETTDVERVMQMIRLNIGTLTELTYRLLPGMIARRHGAVINVASVAAFQPVAYMGVYSATKSYVLHFTEALWAETRDKGVTVMALCPGVTRTAFFDVAGAPGWLKKQRSQTPRQVVKAALKGLEKRRQYVVSGMKNYLLSLAGRVGSRKIVVTESMKYFRPKSNIGPTDEPRSDKPT
ncbi:MAG: SDR family NAD(P)-dependent oxidoreductase [Pirellulaceae bacterium]